MPLRSSKHVDKHIGNHSRKDGVSYLLALGPSAPFWPAAQRLVLQVDGETITDAHYRDDVEDPRYAERLGRLDVARTLGLVAHRPEGGTSYAHALALCQALESLAGVTVPPRAAYVRCAAAELERLHAHIRVLYAMFELLGLHMPVHTLAGLREQLKEAMHLLKSGEDQLDMCVPGGLRHDIDFEEHAWLLASLSATKQQVFELIDRTIDEPRLLARTVEVGMLTREVAEQFGLRGPLARAAGIEVDERLDQPYAAYSNLDVRRVLQEGCDVHARLVVLLLETFESLKLAEQALQDMPDGSWQQEFPHEIPAGQASATVEAPQGLLRCTVEGDGYRLTDIRLDEPPRIDRLLARTLFVGTLLDNVVLIALSTAPSLADVHTEALTTT
jgi:Ni,Fe-hydrogenase III large subunit